MFNDAYMAWQLFDNLARRLAERADLMLPNEVLRKQSRF